LRRLRLSGPKLLFISDSCADSRARWHFTLQIHFQMNFR